MKVLEVLSALDGGGVAHLLYAYCKNSYKEIQYDFVVTDDVEGMLEEPLKELGCKVYHITRMRNNIKNHNTELKKIILEGQYDVVHDHSDIKSFFTLIIAKKCGVRKTIAHSHRSLFETGIKYKIINSICRMITFKYADQLVACGRDSAISVYGKKLYQSGKIVILPNAIDTDVYLYDESIRKDLLKKYGIENKLVIGHVGRFVKEKNHYFILKIFVELLKCQPSSMLVLLGDGPLIDQIKRKAFEYGIADQVLFMGNRDDINQMLNMFDVFLFPSISEGFPVVLVEAQTNGVNVICSDVITNEIKLEKNLTFYSLENTEEDWAKEILKLGRRRNKKPKNTIMKYDIKRNVNIIKKLYE